MTQLYGPFTILTHNPDGSLGTTDAQGQWVPNAPAPGVHYTTDAASFAAAETVLGPYRAVHAWPLQNVLAGDDPAKPTMTVPLVFPDQATADAVIAQLDGAAS